MHKIYRLLSLSVFALISVFVGAISFSVRVSDALKAVPCTLEKLYIELASLVSAPAVLASGNPASAFDFRNSAEKYVTLRKASDPF